MNRRIRRASAGGRYARAWWLTQDHFLRSLLRNTRAIGCALSPAFEAIASGLKEWIVTHTDQEPGQ